MKPEDTPAEWHLSSEQVAAYLDRGLSQHELVQIEAHLVQCIQCRTEIVEVKSTKRSAPGLKRWQVLTPAAAAAAVIAFVVLSPGLFEPSAPGGGPAEGIERATGREGTIRIEPLGPISGAAVEIGGVRLLWGASVGGGFYRVTVIDEAGDVVWSGNTSDTTVALPSDVPLEPDRAYYWYVDALLLDGRSATTGVQEFRTQR